MIEEFLKEGSVQEKDLRKALEYIEKYFGSDLIKRSDVNNGGDDFRSYLGREIKSRLRINKMILVLDRYFEFVVNYNKIMNNDGTKINPFSREWDYFKTASYKGTKRLALDKIVIDDLKCIVLEQAPNALRNMVYMLLSLPLRGSQVQLLDSGLRDELVYSEDQMVKNPNGIAGRSMGILHIINGQKFFFINTNKNGQGFLIKCQDKLLWNILENQIETVQKMDRVLVGKEVLGRANMKVLREGYDLLFRNEDGTAISKSQMYKFWNKVCSIADERFDYGLCEKGKFIYDLHSLRVSLITHYSEIEGLDVISKHISGQESQAIVYGYCKSMKDLSLDIKKREHQKMLEYKGDIYEK